MNFKLPILVAFLTLSSILYFSCNSGGKNSPSEGEEVTKLWKQNCALCHGNDGRLGVNGAKDLRLSELSLGPRKDIITKGKGLMVGFENTLSADQIEALAKYTFTFK